MAKKKQSDESSVTRIKATGTVTPKKTTKKDASKAEAPSPETTPTKKPRKTRKVRPGAIFTPFRAVGRYFKGAWVELRQVRWPTRRATWGMTGAVLAYSAFFVVVVLLLDAGFKYVFELILKK